MIKLTQSTIEKIGHYVYLLIDPRNNQPFYVGKGYRNRIIQHVKDASETASDEAEKIKVIHDIEKSGNKVEHKILRHGLRSSDEAFEVECAVIDFIGMENLTNEVSGHYSADRGLMSLEDIEAKYQAEDAIFKEPTLLININNLYARGISDEALYEATRKYWRVDIERAKKCSFVCAVYMGLIREVYIPSGWLWSKKENRAYFKGSVAGAKIRDEYINKSVAKYWKKGSQNPVKYVAGDLK